MTAEGSDGPHSKSSRGTGARLYRGAVAAFSLVFVGVGLAVLVVTLVNGGGPASVGMVMGIAFVAVGALRLWASSRMGR